MKILSRLFVVASVMLGFTDSLSAQDTIPLFQFGIVADVQYCDCENAGTRHYSESLNKLEEAVATFNKHDLEFVASVGDFIDRDFSSFMKVNEIVQNLKHPLWHAVGNHEWSVLDSMKTEVLAQLNLKKGYYSKSAKGFRFIFLDGNAISLYANAEGSKEHNMALDMLVSLKNRGAPNAYNWNGGLGQEQLKWVKKELAKAKEENQRAIIMCHFPVVPHPGSHNLWDDRELLEILKHHDHIVAYFNGHVHKSHYEQVGNIHYLTFEGMVEQDLNAFAIVSVYEDRLEITGFGREPDRVLRFD